MYGDLYTAERTMNANVEERHLDADRRNLARSMRSPDPQASRWLRSLSCAFGYRLVALGAWLEQRTAAAARDPVPTERLEWN